MTRVVISLTTMPDKFDKLKSTLRSLHDQTFPADKIYLGLPLRCKRLKIDYPEPDEELKQLATIVRVEDYGPITKIAAGLQEEHDPETRIITVDDDMIYPREMIEKLMLHSEEYPDSAIGSAGMLFGQGCPLCAINPNETSFPYGVSRFPIPKEGRSVDSIYGYAGALYVRKFFPDNAEQLKEELFSLSGIDHDMFMNDDIVISAFLSRNEIERRIFQGMPQVTFVLQEDGKRNQKSTEISYNLDTFFKRMERSINKCKELGMYQKSERIKLTETIYAISLIFIFSVILIIIFIAMFFML